MTLYYLALSIFWFSAIVLFYTYVGYPLMVFAISKLRPRSVDKGVFEPDITIIITAYNEEKDIRAKIENTLAIQYPADKLQIMVASDGSTDRTDEIVKEFTERGIELFRQEGRVGKTYTQNKAVENARGEIILFSDATTIYQPDVLETVLPNFADSSVGCVAGRLVYVNEDEAAVGKGTQSYWGYESFIKASESAACSLIGVSGCLYAVRRSAYIPMYPEACSDFLICTVLYRQGLRSVFEPAAVCTEHTNTRTDKEFQMRVRIIAQTFTDLWRNRDMLNPLKHGFYAIQLISHKLLRYLVPIFLLTVFFSTAVLATISLFYAAVLALQLAFYLLAALTLLLERWDIKPGLLSVPMYFVLANVSSAVGLFKFLSGERYVRWEPNR